MVRQILISHHTLILRADDHIDTLTNPLLLVEVLPESTERRDRGAKFQGYRQLASLREYLLVSQTAPHIERCLRGDDDQWTLTDALGRDVKLYLPSIDVALSLSGVYERLDFER
jgi:Uma2 family endonuclease